MWWSAPARAELFALLERADFAVYPTLFAGLQYVHAAGRLPAEWRLGPDGRELHIDSDYADRWIVASLACASRDAAGIYMLAPRTGAARLRRIRHRRDLQLLLEEIADRVSDDRPLADLPDRVHELLRLVDVKDRVA